MNKDEYRGDDVASVALSGEIEIKYPRKLDGGGIAFKDNLIDVVRKTGKTTYNRAYEWCAGFGVLGYELLGLKLCEHIVFSDMYQDAIDNCLDTAMSNKLTAVVTTYHTDKIANIPDSEKWDLVVSNPPHCIDELEFRRNVYVPGQDPLNLDNAVRLCVDQDYKIHSEFFQNIRKHLTQDADIYLIEAFYMENMVQDAINNGLRLVGKYDMSCSTMPQGVILHIKPN
jgi:methylase of polypeptide subunit release factors